MAREFKYAILGKNLQEETVVPQMTHRRKTLAPLLFILALLLILGSESEKNNSDLLMALLFLLM